MRIRTTACLAQVHNISQCLLNSGLSAIKTSLPSATSAFYRDASQRHWRLKRTPPLQPPLEEYSYGQSTAFDSPSHHCRVALKGRVQWVVPNRLPISVHKRPSWWLTMVTFVRIWGWGSSLGGGDILPAVQRESTHLGALWRQTVPGKKGKLARGVELWSRFSPHTHTQTQTHLLPPTPSCSHPCLLPVFPFHLCTQLSLDTWRTSSCTVNR